MLKDSDEGQRLRTSHPIVGVLTQKERESLYDFDWDALKREYEQRTRRPWPTLERDGAQAVRTAPAHRGYPRWEARSMRRCARATATP